MPGAAGACWRRRVAGRVPVAVRPPPLVVRCGPTCSSRCAAPCVDGERPWRQTWLQRQWMGDKHVQSELSLWRQIRIPVLPEQIPRQARPKAYPPRPVLVSRWAVRGRWAEDSPGAREGAALAAPALPGACAKAGVWPVGRRHVLLPPRMPLAGCMPIYCCIGAVVKPLCA